MKYFAFIYFCHAVAVEALHCPHGSSQIVRGGPSPIEEWKASLRKMNSSSVTCKEMIGLWPTCGYVVIPTEHGNQTMFIDCIASLEVVNSTINISIQVSEFMDNFVLVSTLFDEERRSNFSELISNPSITADIYLVPETEMAKELSKYQSDGLNVGVIVGTGVAIILIIGIVVVYCCIRKTRQERQDPADNKTLKEGVPLNPIQADPTLQDKCAFKADPAK